MSDKWELTNGFSILEVLDKLESYFSGMLRKKNLVGMDSRTSGMTESEDYEFG